MAARGAGPPSVESRLRLVPATGAVGDLHDAKYDLRSAGGSFIRKSEEFVHEPSLHFGWRDAKQTLVQDIADATYRGG